MLTFGEREWRFRRDGRLHLFLPSDEHGLGFTARWIFSEKLTPGRKRAVAPRRLDLWVRGWFDGVTDWHAMPGIYGPRIIETEGEEWKTTEPAEEGTARGPQVEVVLSGGDLKRRRRYDNKGWTTLFYVNSVAPDDAYAFMFGLGALFPSPKQNAVLNRIAEDAGEGGGAMEELHQTLDRIPRVCCRGRMLWDEVSCLVPLNAKDPIAWAKRMAREQMGMTEFGLCFVVDGPYDGTFQPHHGLFDEGRLVTLCPPPVYYDGRIRRLKMPRESERP